MKKFDHEAARVTFYLDGKGNWLRRDWQPQCPETVFIFERCQGVKGHAGDHWCYSSNGNYQYDVSGDLQPHDIAGGSIPPDHETYRHPSEMQRDHYYGLKYIDSPVTLPEEIDRLNRRDIKDGESLDVPFTGDEMSLADCSGCWSNPCDCGLEYKHWTPDEIYAHIGMLVKVLTVKESSPLQPIIDRISADSRREGIQ